MLIDHCLICDNVCDSHNLLCLSCLATLESEMYSTFMSTCPSCHYPIVSSEYRCPRCLKSSSPSGKAFPVFCVSTYDGNLSYTVLQRFKFKNDKKLAKIVALMINKGLAELDAQHDAVIVPIPCSKASLKKRGWDQMKEVSKYLNREVLDLLTVSTTSNTQQKLLDRAQRINKNTKRFELSKKYGLNKLLEHLRDRQIILIDDVSTTFSTLSMAYDTLKKLGFEDVKAVVWLYDLKAEKL